jgi:hypothetical protein
MRNARLLFGVIVMTAVAALGLAATTVAQDGRGQDKVSLCHETGVGFVQVQVAEPAVDAHLAHGDLMPDDYGGCPPGGVQPGGLQGFFSALFNAFFNALFNFLARFLGEQGSPIEVGLSP